MNAKRIGTLVRVCLKVFILKNFEALGLSPITLKALDALGYEDPTPIQREAIPLVLSGQDLMGLAQTGTGKTAAFGLPLIHQLIAEGAKPDPKSVRALILAPTRELANQISENLRGFVRKTPLKVATVVGGGSINVQIRNLHRGIDILVATPGRLLDLVERKAIFLNTAKFLVLDEADQMLDLGFIHALRKISRLLGTPRQTLLFSATMPKQIEELSRAYLNDPVRIEMAPSGRVADRVQQSIHFVHQRAKTDLLKNCLIERRDDLSLVFARTKHGAEKLMKHLVECGFAANSIHGNKSQGQRDRAIRAFKSGETRVLVATDVAARGIDISGVSHVYNFDLPEVPENYVHRIGRTARAGREGVAIAFCAPTEIHLLRGIEKLMGISIDVASGERGEGERPSKGRDNQNNRRRSNGPKRQQPGRRSKNKRSDQPRFKSEAPAGERSGSEASPANSQKRRRAGAGAAHATSETGYGVKNRPANKHGQKRPNGNRGNSQPGSQSRKHRRTSRKPVAA